MKLAHSWTPVSVRLSYRLGEIGLFHKQLSGLANREHFSRCTPYDEVPDISGQVMEGQSFVYFPTYPVRVVPPPVVSRGDWIAYTPYTFRNYYIDLRRFDSFEHYLQSVFSSKSRNTLLRKVRKFAQADGGEAQWCRFDRPEDMSRFFEEAGAISSKSYQERLLDAGLPRDPEFIARTRSLAAAQRAFGFVLYFEQRPVAYLLSLCQDGVASYDYLGYDPAVQALSPGTVLHYHALKSIFESGAIELFDFTEGEGQHKAFFASDHQLCAKTYFLRRNLLHLMLVRLHYGLNRGVEAAGRTLDRIGLKSAVKRFIRKAA